MKSLIILWAILPLLVYASDIPLKRIYPVDEKINPCENLYQYSCNKVIDSFKLRDDRSMHVFAFNDSSERILDFKKDYLEKLSTLKPKNDKEVALKNYFLGCMNREALAKEENEFVIKKISDLAKMTSKENFVLDRIFAIGTPEQSLLALSALDNFDDARISDANLYTNYNFLPEKTYIENAELMSSLEELAVDFFKAIKMENPENKAHLIINFERSVAAMRLSPIEARNRYNMRTELKRADLIKQGSWLKVKKIFKLIPKKVLIRNVNPKMIPFLNETIEKYSLDDLKTIEIFYSLQPLLDAAYPDYYNKRFVFKHKFFGGPKIRAELKEECTKNIMNNFDKEIDFLVMPLMFKDFPADKVKIMVEKTRLSIINSIQKNTWLSPPGKKEAIKKMETAYLRLVAPKTIREWDFLPVKKYSIQTPLKNKLTRETLYYQKDISYLFQMRDIRLWQTGPLLVNAFYEASANQFTMLQGILQYPFFDTEGSELENLAGIGMVVGHELGHGIDDQGSRYDAKGRLHQWMTDDDLKKFKEITRPLIDQYTKAGMNGELTLGENIGDLVGLKAAYDVYFQDTNHDKTEDLKKFFLSYARSWCEVQRPKIKEYRIKSDPHSLGEQRVNEIVKHFSGFQKAFECKALDPMVLSDDKRVKIW